MPPRKYKDTLRPEDTHFYQIDNRHERAAYQRMGQENQIGYTTFAKRELLRDPKILPRQRIQKWRSLLEEDKSQYRKGGALGPPVTTEPEADADDGLELSNEPDSLIAEEHPEELIKPEDLRRWILGEPPSERSSCFWQFAETIYERGHRMVIKTTVWDPSNKKSTYEHQNSSNAAKTVSQFPVFTEHEGPTNSPRLKGMHTVWESESFETESKNLDSQVLEDTARKMRKDWDELAEKDKEAIKESITAPSLRQYLDWSPGKSLDKLIARYGHMDPDPSNQEGSESGRDCMGKPIPEPFIWLVFYNVATVLHYVSTKGSFWTKDSSEAEEGQGDFDTLVHCDIKPGNIFLSEPQKPYDKYPNPQLGDWDLALDLKQFDKKNTEIGRGDRGWRAPENRPEDEDSPDEEELPPGEEIPLPDLSSKTDICSLGLVIWELMYSTVETYKRENLRSDRVKKYKFENFDAEALGGNKGRYSIALHVLRDQCLHINPIHRPTPHMIALECKRNLEDQLPNSVGKFSNGEIDPHLQLSYKREQFKLHIKFKRGRSLERVNR